MSLKDIYCQDNAIEILQRAVTQNRLGHAYIFAGIDGVGKGKTAGQWAKILLCQNRIDNEGFVDSCSRCKSCQLFESDSHPDFVHIYKELYKFTDKGKNSKRVPLQLPIDVIRQFLIEKVSSKASMGSYRIYVISETEKLNSASQNAMLKVLEEPPGHCILILLCSSVDKLLPTTRSRCQIIRFGGINREIIVKELLSDGADEREAGFWAGFCQGSIGMALMWNKLNAYNIKMLVVSGICKLTAADVPELVEKILIEAKQVSLKWSQIQQEISKSDLNRRVQKGVVDIICSVYRDAVKIITQTGQALINSDQSGEIEFLAAKIDADKACKAICSCYDAINWVQSNTNEQLVYERLLLELAK